MGIIQWDGEKISNPGIYRDLPIDRYHSDIAIGPSISSSGLRVIDGQSPAHYWIHSPYNPERIEQESNAAFDFGKAAHTLLMGEGKFKESFMLKAYPDFRTNEAKAWRNAQIAAGKVIISEDDLANISGIAKSMERCPEIKAGLFDGLVEHSIFWQDPKTGVWLKSRPDVIPSSDGVLVDLKTTTDASPRKVDKSILDYGYPSQGALAAWGMRAAAGIKIEHFVLVFVEKTPPWAVSIVEVDARWMDIGGKQIRRAIRIFAECMKTGDWPFYGPPRTAYAPDWLEKQMDMEEASGLLPGSIEG